MLATCHADVVLFVAGSETLVVVGLTHALCALLEVLELLLSVEDVFHLIIILIKTARQIEGFWGFGGR